MDKSSYQIKLVFVEGLSEVVEEEINVKTSNLILFKEKDYFCLDFNDSFLDILDLKSISTASLIMKNDKYNPGYLSKHKSILGKMINIVTSKSPDKFKTFRLSCAGSDSKEVKSLLKYIELEFKLIENNEADLKINIFKSKDIWEIAIQVTSRPLSVRFYKVVNMSGAMDPNIAYALNYYCELQTKSSYLNVFSGSSTLLIEAALKFDNLRVLVGFDMGKKHLSYGYQNIQKAGLIKKIRLLEYDVFNAPDLGQFDVIVADLPFGMVISKNKNLDSIYKAFIDYTYKSVAEKGIMGVYTSEADTFINQLDKDKWAILKIVDLKLVTSINSYLYPKIVICKKL